MGLAGGSPAPFEAGASPSHNMGAESPPKQRCWGASAWTELRGPDLGPTAQDTVGCDLPSSLPVKREVTGPAQELATSAVVLSRSPMALSPAGLSQAMLAWRMEDEGRIIKAVITGRVWRDGDSFTPAWSLLVFLVNLCVSSSFPCCWGSILPGSGPAFHSCLDPDCPAFPCRLQTTEQPWGAPRPASLYPLPVLPACRPLL